MNVPWRDRRGRLLPIKAVVLAAAFIPGLFYIAEWPLGMLGPRPLNEVIHGFGLWTVRILLLSLAITPLARTFEWPRALLVRRMVGVTAAIYGAIHLSLYVADQGFAPLVVVSEIVKRFYLTIGFVALLGLGALAVTSTEAMTKRVGVWWKRLHRLVYPIGVLAIWHYFIQAKANVSEPVFVAGLFLWLMAWRALPEAWRRPWYVYPVLAAVVGFATAWVEFGWYAVATRVNPWRVLAANETVDYGLRPAHWVFVTALIVSAALLARRLQRGRGTPARGVVRA